MQGNWLFKSTSARLSFLYAALIIAAFFIVGVVIWFTARNTAEFKLREDIELEISAIKTELENEGLQPMLEAIRARAEHPGSLEYWVTDAAGRRLAGDFPSMDGPDGWRHITIGRGASGAERREEMLIRTVTLPGGIRLSVGDDLRLARAVQDSILSTMAPIGGAAVLVCLIVGVLVTRRALSRMQALNATLEKVAAGDVTARYQASTPPLSDIERIGLTINMMLDRIEQLVGDVQQVTRDIAHDLRTPLTHLQQRIEQVKLVPDEAGRIEAIEAAQLKVAEILRIFDALLRLSEIETGAAGRRFKPIDLAAITEKVSDAYRPDIEDSGHRLVVAVPGSCPVQGDSDLLAQAAANLIENAMRHTPPGTNIAVRVFYSGDKAVLEISDNGPGIPARSGEVIIKPFVRLDRSRSTAGSGLGLSLVAAIARFHGAEMNMTDAHPGLIVSLIFKATPKPREKNISL